MIGALDWVHLAWPMMAATCLALAYFHVGLWLRLRDRYAHLMLAAAATAVAAIAGFELAFMYAPTPEQANDVLRWVQLPTFFLLLSFAGYARFYFGSVRRWLLACALLSRAVVVWLAFALPAGTYYRSVEALKQIVLPGGVRVNVLEGPLGPWAYFAALTWLFLPALVADSAYQAWRRSPPVERPRIARIAAAIVAFLVLSALHSFLVRAGVLESPYLVTPIFCLVILVLASDLAADVARASQLADRLRASEARLRESEADRELAVDAAALALWSLDVSKGELRGSGRFREILGLESDPPYQLATVLEAVHPDDLERVRSELDSAFASGEIAHSEVRIRAPQGGWRWVRYRGRIDRASSAEGVTLRGVSYEVTRLRLAEERFRRIVDSAPNALLIVDADGRVTFVNQHALDLFGYSAEEFAGLELERLVPDRLRGQYALDRGRFAERPRAGPIGIGLELFGRRKDGTELPIEVALAPLPAEDGGLAVVTVTDITHRRQQELASARQHAELTHLSRVAVLGELSASLAHELNQPLAAILANAQAAQNFLKRDRVDLEELRAIIGDIVTDDKRAGDVIHRLRAMLRKEELPRVPLDLSEITRQVLRIVRSDLVNRDVVTETELAENLPAVAGDAVQLQQVLLNLIVNACDAMAGHARPRTLTVRTRIEAQEVWSEVGDLGTGIPEPELDRIFEPFVTTKPQGTGLGLSVCRTIVASHGGRIWARNNPAGGATVTMALPVQDRSPA